MNFEFITISSLLIVTGIFLLLCKNLLYKTLIFMIMIILIGISMISMGLYIIGLLLIVVYMGSILVLMLLMVSFISYTKYREEYTKKKFIFSFLISLLLFILLSDIVDRSGMYELTMLHYKQDTYNSIGNYIFTDMEILFEYTSLLIILIAVCIRELTYLYYKEVKSTTKVSYKISDLIMKPEYGVYARNNAIGNLKRKK